MSLAELLESAQFVVDNQGNKKAVMFDFATWQAALPLLERLEDLETQLATEELEEAKDIQAVLEIEARIARGEEPIRDWDEFEAELDELSA